METIKDVFAAYKQALSQLYDASEVEGITLMAVSEIADLSRAKIKAFPELELTGHQSDKLTAILNELNTGKPIQYILGTTEF